LKPAIFGDLTFRFADRGRRGQILRGCPAVNLPGELKMRTMSGIVWFGAMAPRLSATPDCTGDGTWLKVAQFRDIAEQGGAFAGQSRERVDHRGTPFLTVYCTLKNRPQKRRIANPSLFCRAPGYDRVLATYPKSRTPLMYKVAAS
jgi:hypothetical protein